MSDLVERLRNCCGVQSGDPECCCAEAADEIEHLNGIIKTAMGGKRAFEDRIALIKEIERLRADLKKMDWEQRKHTIERCARVAEEYDGPSGKHGVAAAIRKLKDSK